MGMAAACKIDLWFFTIYHHTTFHPWGGVLLWWMGVQGPSSALAITCFSMNYQFFFIRKTFIFIKHFINRHVLWDKCAWMREYQIWTCQTKCKIWKFGLSWDADVQSIPFFVTKSYSVVKVEYTVVCNLSSIPVKISKMLRWICNQTYLVGCYTVNTVLVSCLPVLAYRTHITVQYCSCNFAVTSWLTSFHSIPMASLTFFSMMCSSQRDIGCSASRSVSR